MSAGQAAALGIALVAVFSSIAIFACSRVTAAALAKPAIDAQRNRPSRSALAGINRKTQREAKEQSRREELTSRSPYNFANPPSPNVQVVSFPSW